MRAYSGSGVVESEFFPVDSNEDGFCRCGRGLPAAHGALHLGAFVVQFRCLCADLDQLIKRRGFQVSDRESSRHAGVASSHVGHTHNVIEDTGYPAAVHVPRWAFKGLVEPHGPRNPVRRLLPE